MSLRKFNIDQQNNDGISVPKLFFTYDDVRKIFGMSRTSLHRAMKSELPPPIKIYGSKKGWHRDTILAIVDAKKGQFIA